MNKFPRMATHVGAANLVTQKNRVGPDDDDEEDDMLEHIAGSDDGDNLEENLVGPNDEDDDDGDD